MRRPRNCPEIPGADALSGADRRGEPLCGQGRPAGLEQAAAHAADTDVRPAGDRVARPPPVGGAGTDPGGRSVSWSAAVAGDRGGPDRATAPVAARRADGGDV